MRCTINENWTAAIRFVTGSEHHGQSHRGSFSKVRSTGIISVIDDHLVYPYNSSEHRFPLPFRRIRDKKYGVFTIIKMLKTFTIAIITLAILSLLFVGIWSFVLVASQWHSRER